MTKNSIFTLALLKSASIASSPRIIVSFTKTNIKLLNSLYTNGFIQNFSKLLNKKVNKIYLLVILRYFFNIANCHTIKLISKPSFYFHLKFSDLCYISDKTNTIFLSTTKGILTLNECKHKNIGGLLLFKC